MDIATRDGDILLSTTGDLLLVDERDYLVRRALEIPLGHVAIWVPGTSDFRLVDADVGNALYNYLSDPLNLDWIGKADIAITNALRALPSVYNIRDVDIQVTGPREVRINVVYNDNRSLTTTLTPS